VGGFSLIEILVTLLIISLALLGTVGLQAYSLRMNQGSQFRTQAVFLVSDLAERIEANKEGAVAGQYAVPATTAADFEPAATTACDDNPCNPAGLAGYDLAIWQAEVANRRVLPQSSWEVTYVATSTSSGVYTIRVGWVDRQTDATAGAFDEATGVGANADGTGERFFYTATRTVFN